MMVVQLIVMCGMARVVEGMLGSLSMVGLAMFVVYRISWPVWKAVSSREGSTEKRLGRGQRVVRVALALAMVAACVPNLEWSASVDGVIVATVLWFSSSLFVAAMIGYVGCPGRFLLEQCVDLLSKKKRNTEIGALVSLVLGKHVGTD